MKVELAVHSHVIDQSKILSYSSKPIWLIYSWLHLLPFRSKSTSVPSLKKDIRTKRPPKTPLSFYKWFELVFNLAAAGAPTESLPDVEANEFVKCMAKCLAKSVAQIEEWYKECHTDMKCWEKKVGFKALACVGKCVKLQPATVGEKGKTYHDTMYWLKWK